MKNFIPQSFIKNLLDQIDIIEIIRERIELIKNGNNYYAICPFHQETKPSFTINKEKQYFYCFGCNISGNVIDFLMKYNQLKFIDSIKEITKILGISIPKQYIHYNAQQQYNKKKIFYESIKVISSLYHNNIKSNNARIARLYLQKRNICDTMINYFNIGFSLQNKELVHLIINNNNIHHSIKNNILIHIKIHNNQYDQFYNRIIFPIKDQYNHIIGFGGRTLRNSQHPKYINSPTTELFNKSYVLYGIEKIKKKNKKIKYIIVVEGYFDVISLTQFDIKNVVASLGTMITKYQIQKLFQITNNIIYCYDGDISGEKAAWRTLKITLPYIYNERHIKFIFLPDKEDPDSIIRKEGKKKFNQRIQNATNMIDFFFMKLCKNINLSTIENKNILINKAIPLINKIPNTFFKMYFKKILGEKIGILDAYHLECMFYKKKPKNNKIIQLNKMRILISLIIKFPKLYNSIPYSLKELKKIKISGLPLFIEIIKICKIFHNITTGQLIEFYRKKTKTYNILKKIIILDNMIEDNNINYVFVELIIHIYTIALEKKYNNLIIKDRIKKLNTKEKYILWKINKTLKKK